MSDNSIVARSSGRDELVAFKLRRRDLDRVRQFLSALPHAQSRLLVEIIPDDQLAEAPANAQLLQRRALSILASRRRRSDIFGQAMFGELAWEMLLLLYALASEARQTVNRLAELSRASKTTALRWLSYLEAQRLVCREPHPTDRRKMFVALTDKGKEMIELYLSDTAPFDE